MILFHPKELQRNIADIDSELECLSEVTSEELMQESRNITKRKRAKTVFKEKPKDGIKILVAEGFVKETPEDIAYYLKTEEMLDKRAIGDYLGEMKEFNIDTLKAFIRLHDFEGRTLVDALRDFLWSFHLPGEAQKIDRIMELFAMHFCECNPGVFSNTDTCYVLAYSVIMLNTSLHNPSVKDKPTPEKFVSMNRGIDDGKDLPRDLLLELYESIKRKAFEVPDQSQLAETFFNPEREGWLTKEGGKHRSKHKRWFILKDSVLYYFKNSSAHDDELIGSIPLDFLKVRDASQQNGFEIYIENGVIKAWKKDSDNKVVKGNHNRYLLMAQNPEEKAEWMKCIEKSINDTVYNGFKERKRKLAQDIPGVY
jgi:cytohesin